MLAEREPKVRKDVLDVFKKLGLEDAAERERFKNLANMSGSPILTKRGDDFPRTRNNTIEEPEDVHA